MKKVTFFARVAAISAAVTFSFSAQAQSEILFAFNGDLSGTPSAASGQAGLVGLQVAIEDINAAGGVLGRKIKLLIRDDTGQPPKSIQNIIELIDSEKVSVIFGPTNTGNALAFKHITQQKKIPVMGCIAVGTEVTKPVGSKIDNYMFRISQVDRYGVAAMLAYAKKNTAIKNLGIIIENTSYGAGGLADAQDIMKMQGLKATAIERIGFNDTDMTSQLSKLRAAGVDTILLWAQGTPIAQTMRSMEKINYYPLVLPSWSADNASFYDAAGQSLAERLFFLSTVPAVLNSVQQKMYERTASRIPSQKAFPYVLHCYDAMQLVAQAIRQAGSIDGAAVKTALEDLKTPIKGVLKTYDRPFSSEQREGLVPSDLQWMRWKDGKLATYSDNVVKSLVPSDFKK